MTPMERPTTAHPLLILAMGQRDSFAKRFGTEEPDASPEQVEQMRSSSAASVHHVHVVFCP